MGYLEIENLYKNQQILLFKKIWATEKIHGTSAWITYKDDNLFYHSGGGSADVFKALFNHEKLLALMREKFGTKKVKLHGEFYGGKINKMSHMYGKNSDFILFDIRVEDMWLSFDKTIALGGQLGLQVVDSVIIDATPEEVMRVARLPSTIAAKKEMGEHLREGLVLHPLEEFTSNNGSRVIAKYRNPEYDEVKTPRAIDDPAKLKVLTEAKAIAEEWVTAGRLSHLMSNPTKYGLPADPDKKDTGDVIKAMIADVEKESKGETVITDAVKKAIGEKARKEFFNYLNDKIKG